MSGLKDGCRRVRLGNGFSNNHVHRVNHHLDLARLPVTLCLPLLGVDLIARPGLASKFLTCCPWGFLFSPSVRLSSVVHFPRHHLRPRGPFIFLFRSWGLVSQTIKCGCPAKSSLAGRGRLWSGSHMPFWRCSQKATSAASLTGGRSASFTSGDWVNLSRISVVAAATPRATLAAKSGVDIAP